MTEAKPDITIGAAEEEEEDWEAGTITTTGTAGSTIEGAATETETAIIIE